MDADKPAANPEAAPRAILSRAVAAQGKLKQKDIHDLQVLFEGQIQERGQATQSVKRQYWLRSGDDSFRIRTVAGLRPSDPVSERGVLGGKPESYWEWARKRRMPLKLTNREHRKNIDAIQRDRREFQRIVKSVLLARLLDEGTTVAFARSRSVLLDKDEPASARHVFPDRKARFAVIDVRRAGSDPLRFFIHEGDFTVRKVIQFDARRPGAVKSITYLGAYPAKAVKGGLRLPRSISVYSDVPTDKKSRDEFVRIAGRLTVKVNQKLGDDVFAPK